MYISSFPHGRRGVHALLWSIFAFLFCLSTTRGCSFMKIDGFLIPINPFIKVSWRLTLHHGCRRFLYYSVIANDIYL